MTRDAKVDDEQIMKVCLMCHDPRPGTGYGLDRYSSQLVYNLHSRLNTLYLIRQGRLDYDPVRWALDELTIMPQVLKAQADVYHAASQLLCKNLVLARKRPIVTTIHDMIPFPKSLTSHEYTERSLSYMYQRLSIRLCKMSDRVIVPFEITKNDAADILGIERKRIDVIRLGVDHSIFHPIPEIKHNPNLLLFVGTVTKSKGVDILLRSFYYVVREVKDAKLWIGGKGRDLDFMVRLTRHLGLINRVKFLGFIPEPDLPYYYNKANVVCLPSRVGFCLQIFEAMACGTPVITLDSPEVREVVRKGVVLSARASSDVHSLADAIINLMQNQELRQNMARYAVSEVKQYSWTMMALKTIDVYKDAATYV